MQTKPKSNSIVTHARLPGGELEFTVVGAGKFTFNPLRVHANNRQHAELHGWIQRITDGAAIPRNTKTGASATPQEKMEAMKELAEHYMSGADQWRLTASVGEGKGLTIEAIARVKGVTYAIAEGYVEQFAKAKHGGDTRKALAFLRDGSRVREAMEAIRAERLPQAKIDADAALDEFENEEESLTAEELGEMANLLQDMQPEEIPSKPEQQ